MKAHYSTNKLWKQAKELPAELPLDKVNLIIADLPNFPVANNWIHHLFTKSSIMTSVSITLVISLILSLNTFQPKEEIAEQGIQHKQDLPETFDKTYFKAIPSVKLEPDSVPKQNDPTLKSIQKILPLESVRETQLTLVDSIPTTQSQEQAFPPILLSEKLTETSAKYPQLILPVSPSQGSIFALDSISQLQMVGSTNYESFGRYNDLPIGKIKRSLRRSLSKDQLITNRNSTIRIELPQDKIIVNGKTLESPLSQKYKDLFKSWGIANGPYHEIRISPKYIMIGDFAPDGFTGRARGRDMELKFKGDDQQGIFDH